MATSLPNKEELAHFIESVSSSLDKAAQLTNIYFNWEQSTRKNIELLQDSLVVEEMQLPPYPKTREQVQLKAAIDLNDSSNAALLILEKLYFEQHHTNKVAQLEELQEYLIRYELDKALAQVRNSGRRMAKLFYFFSNRSKKEKLQEQFQRLEHFQAAYQATIMDWEEWWKEDNQPSRDVLFTDFLSNEDTYYQVLKEKYDISRSFLTSGEYASFKSFRSKLEPFSEKMASILHYRQWLQETARQSLYEMKKDDIMQEFHNTTLQEFDEMYPEVIQNGTDLRNQDIFTIEDVLASVPLSEKVRQQLDRYLEEITYSLPVRFNTVKQSKEETSLLQVLHLFIEERHTLDDMIEFSGDVDRNQMEWKMARIEQLNSYWKVQQSVQSQEEKEQLQETMNEVELFIQRRMAELQQLYHRLNQIKMPEPERVWAHFEQEAAAYYAALDKYFYTGKKNTDVQRKTNLSQKILQKIETFHLKERKLKATLRSWQHFGTKYALVQKKVLIGDEMGLGKTLISIAVMAHLAEEGKRNFLVICPSSIMENWMREVRKHSQLIPYKLHGTRAHRDAVFEEWKRDGGVGITTFETARRFDFTGIPLDVLTADEAHYVKNPHAKRSKNVYELSKNSDYTIFLTGTPLENHTAEMTALIHVLQPDIAHTIRNPKIHHRAELYRKEIAPVYLRRTKQDVQLELPPLTQIEEWEEFGAKEEWAFYKEAVAEGHFMKMRRAAWTGGTPKKSPKLERLQEICEEAAENKEKVIVFSFFKDVIKTIEANLPKRVVGVINGDVPISQRQELIDRFRESTDKNVIVAQVNTAAHGLNMQFASIVVFCEPQIKPSLENQAVARAYRMGQTQSVFVYRLLTPDSIDEWMMEMLGNKQKLFDAYADKSYMHAEAAMLDEKPQMEENMKQKIIQLEQARLGFVEEETLLEQRIPQTNR